jgi:hypothetical protein
VSESAASAKPLLVYGLARNRRSPKRPSEPAAKRASPRKSAQWRKDAKPPRVQIGRRVARMLRMKV